MSDEFVRACAAGRVIINPAESLWAKPCPVLEDLEPLVIDMEDGSKLGMLLCPEHMNALTGKVTTWMDSIGDLKGRQN